MTAPPFPIDESVSGVGSGPESNETGPDRGRPSRAKVALLVALLLLPVGVWAVAAQTSARFAALIPVGRARLMVGTVDIDAELTQRADVMLAAANMAPGDDVFGGITSSNVGTKAVRYRVSASVVGDLPDGWVSVETWSPSPDASVEDCLDGPGDARSGGSNEQPAADPQGPLDSIDLGRLPSLPAGRSVVTCIVVGLDRSAPNEAQNRDLDVAVVVDAIQDPTELVANVESIDHLVGEQGQG